MKIFRTYDLLFILLVFTSCGKKYNIDGVSSVDLIDGRMLYLKAYTNGDSDWVNIDSSEIVHGKFIMKGKVDSDMMASLYMDDECIMPLVLEDGHIHINISQQENVATGTPLNDTLYTFVKRKNSLTDMLDDLQHKEARLVLNGGDYDEIHRVLSMRADSIVKATNDYVKQVITHNYNNVVGQNIFLMLCNSMPYPIITPIISDIIKGAPESFKRQKLINEFLTKAKENRQIIAERQRMEQNIQIKKSGYNY
ncbi:MAG: DUF4369 domain-containing protein [Bacteroidaceae bacterium]